MFIRNIRIEGFKIKDRVIDLKFSDTPITILYGDNGCGKTTLLRVLSALFSQDEEVLEAENIQKVVIELEDNEEIKKYVLKRELKELQEEDRVTGELYSRHINKFVWDNFPTEIRTLLFGVNRGISNNIAVQPNQIERYFEGVGNKYLRIPSMTVIERIAEELANFLRKEDVWNRNRLRLRTRRMTVLNKKNAVCDGLDMGTIENLILERYQLAEQKKNERVQNALFSTLSKAIYKSKDEGKIEFNHDKFKKQLAENRIKLLESIKDTGENELQRKLISILDNENISEIIDECDSNELLKTLLFNMIAELEQDETILESISKIKEIFNAHISKNKELCIDEKGVRIEFGKIVEKGAEKDSCESHGLASLSSGERHLLSFLTVCILNAQTKDIVMIDEPELSLNGKWKRTILDELQKLLPNTQIIVATHSSTVVNGKYNALSKLV